MEAQIKVKSNSVCFIPLSLSCLLHLSEKNSQCSFRTSTIRDCGLFWISDSPIKRGEKQPTNNLNSKVPILENSPKTKDYPRSLKSFPKFSGIFSKGNKLCSRAFHLNRSTPVIPRISLSIGPTNLRLGFMGSTSTNPLTFVESDTKDSLSSLSIDHSFSS